MLPAMLAAAVPGLIAGAASLFGQESANRTNIDIANRTNAFNAEEAERARNFEAMMSNTAIQRRKQDLINAGMNPLLAATDGATTPGGSAASGVSTRVENALGAGISSAMQATQLRLQAKKNSEEVENLKKQNELISSQKNKTDMETKVMSKGLLETEVKNDILDVIRPYLKGIKSGIQSNTIRMGGKK